MEIRMRIIGGAIILVIAVWLYVVSTRMVNKDKKEKKEYKEVEVKFIFLEIQGCDGTVCFNLQSINYFQIFIHHSLSRTMVIFLFYTLYHTPYCIRHTHHIPVRHHRSRRQTEPTVEQGFRYPVDVGGGGGEYGL